MSTVHVRREGDKLAVTFLYDPQVVAAIKSVPERKWSKGTKRWYMPFDVDTYDALSAACLRAGATPVFHGDITARIEQQRAREQEAQAIVQKGDAAVIPSSFYFTMPYAHQRAGLAYLTKMGSAGLTWDMGTGKTKAAIDFCEWVQRNQTDDIRVLVLAPNGVVDKWGDEVTTHAGHSDYALLRAPLTLVQRAERLGKTRYSILNHEAMGHDGPLTKALLALDWDVVIVDESHRYKNPRAQRTKRLLKLHAQHRVILTGTPLTNSAEDVWAQLSFLRPGLLGSWWRFQQTYLERDFFGNVTGVRRDKEQELAERIASVTYRVRKDEVLDLPPKVYEDVRVTMGAAQRERYETMRDELRMVLDSGDTVVAHSILTQLLRLTQVTAGLYGEGDAYQWDEQSAKLTELDRILNDDLRGEQVVVFGVYRRELEELSQRYGNHPIIYGGVRPEVRADHIRQFQAGHHRLLFVQAHSGGIGIDLTAAQYAVYYTRGWSMEDYQQSQDRLHRIGQRGTVTILHLIAADTVDEQVGKALAQKLDLARRLTGDKARQLATEVLTR